MIGFVNGLSAVGAKRAVKVSVCRRGSVVRMTKDDVPEMSTMMRLGVEATTLAAMLTPSVAMAADEAPKDDALKALFKTKVLSLAHPAVMWLLFGSAVFAFYLGNQVKELRTTTDKERKAELAKGKVGQRHWNLTSGILAAMTFFTFEGMANTYTRTGKLFPGPHLYNGLGLVTVMAFMAALTPAMQKNKDWARKTHFGLAFVALGLFGWQAQSGMQITFKLLGLA